MNSSSKIIHHKSKNDYLASRGKMKTAAQKVAEAPTTEGPAAKNDLTQVPKQEMATQSSNVQSAKILDNAKKVAKNIAKAPPVTPLVKAPKLMKNENAEVKKVESAQEANQVIDKPGIFFIEGLDMLSLVSSDGIGEMADKIPAAENFSWSDTDEIIEQISKRPANQPIVLVGHSLGGDTAIEIANELNSVEHGFRNIDLIVTLDSVGFNNDIIPENVKTNLNFIGDDQALFNDGANIARDNKFTQVINELRLEGHREIDDSRSVQFKIFKAIESTFKNAELSKKVEQSLEAIKESKRGLESFDMLPLKPF